MFKKCVELSSYIILNVSNNVHSENTEKSMLFIWSSVALTSESESEKGNRQMTTYCCVNKTSKHEFIREHFTAVQ